MHDTVNPDNAQLLTHPDNAEHLTHPDKAEHVNHILTMFPPSRLTHNDMHGCWARLVSLCPDVSHP